MDSAIGLLIGIGLSAACGFRVFVPLLCTAIAVRSGHMTVSQEFMWMTTDTALLAFSIATFLEVAAYYVPWLDNALDSISAPAAVIAGTMVTAAMLGDMSPLLKWSLAIIAGGGVAGVIKAGTAALRGVSSVTTAGIANPIVSTGELAGSLATTGMAMTLPVVTLALVAFLLALSARFIMRVTRAASRNPPPLPTAAGP